MEQSVPAFAAPSSLIATSGGTDAARPRAAREPDRGDTQFQALLQSRANASAESRRPQFERADRGEASARTQRSARSDQAERPGRPERPEPPQKPAPPERGARPEKPEPPERGGRPEKPAPPERTASAKAEAREFPNEDPAPVPIATEQTGPNIIPSDLLAPITEVIDPRDGAIDPAALQGVDPNAAVLGKEAAAAIFTQAPIAPALVSALANGLPAAPASFSPSRGPSEAGEISPETGAAFSLGAALQIGDPSKGPSEAGEISPENGAAFSLDAASQAGDPSKAAPNSAPNAAPLPPGAFAQLVQAAQTQNGRNPQSEAGPAPLDAASSTASADPSASITPPPPGQAQAPPAIAPSAQAARPVPHVPSIAREIVHLAKDGARSFELRLDPIELGRIDVRLDIAKDNSVTATLTADNPQTLADLARNARDLERALNSAGLQLAQNGLSFDLSRRDGQGDRDRPARNDEAVGPSRTIKEGANALPIAPAAQRWSNARINLIA